MTEPFAVKDCALIAIATGMRAQNLRELRERLRTIDPNCIYYHFWGGLLRPRFDDPEHHNDFAIWVAKSLHNKTLAERLAVIDPVAFDTLDALRDELIDVIDESLDQTEFPKWAERDDQFEFIRSQIVVFDTGSRAEVPRDFIGLLPGMSAGSIFYHFIDARRRRENALDDFQNWLSACGEDFEHLCYRINRIDPYFTPLTRLRDELAEVFRAHFQDR